jgi:carbamoyltransferase
MLVLGIQKDHHSSVCLYEDNKLIYYCEEERLTREKRKNNLPFLCINQIVDFFCKKIDVAITTGYNFDNTGECGAYLKHVKLIDDVQKQVFSFYKGHHLLHAAKAFYDSGFENSYVFVVDGRGSTFNLNNGNIAHETSSVYFFENPNTFKCLYKKCYTNSQINKNLSLNLNCENNVFYDVIPLSVDKNTVVEIHNELDLGFFYSEAAKHFNFYLEEGKLMGLSAYGRENKYLKKILNSGELWFKKYGDIDNLQKINIEKFPELKCEEKNIDNLINFSFLIQEKFEDKYFEFIKKHHDSKISNNIVLTGGTALNVVNNYKLKQKLQNVNLFIEPLCGDEGNSIAACQFYLKQINPNIKFNKLENLFIGNKYNYDSEFCDNEISSKKITPNQITDLLIQGEVVALYQGKSEAGPRALGNRSLLLDPRIANGKDIMNQIKKREKFRPFACSILLEKANEWFDMGGLEESPFMMYAVNSLKDIDKKIPSVIHVDGTCRVQTVTEKFNKILYYLLLDFNKKTNCPILMHTSFNLAGDPLVETQKEAIDTLKNSKLKYIYFADIETLVYKKDFK